MALRTAFHAHDGAEWVLCDCRRLFCRAGNGRHRSGRNQYRVADCGALAGGRHRRGCGWLCSDVAVFRRRGCEKNSRRKRKYHFDAHSFFCTAHGQSVFKLSCHFAGIRRTGRTALRSRIVHPHGFVRDLFSSVRLRTYANFKKQPPRGAGHGYHDFGAYYEYCAGCSACHGVWVGNFRCGRRDGCSAGRRRAG